MVSRRILLALPAAFAAGEAAAHSYRHGDLMIGHAWCLPSEGPTTRAFMPLAVVQGQPDALTGASTPVAEAVQFVPVAGQPPTARWDIIPRRPIGMRADGPHVMLTGLKRPLRVRERFALTLVFERNGPKEVEIWVERSPYSS
ncbi:MAG: copper chaperone PCu(A)C [Phreatobacter sp.]|uniref:copper chaperone PCu(A)C n=1 Tax=Phreatobacter sp. TaxID=1966341 RepID=UPI002736B6E1|nr:copper chaperone PCu(A)C [Phreatobacter sp.]MDP2800709.1 copper chaperone PCu(A)C [Phreatobacter sp.]